MSLGPVEELVVKFPGNQFKGEIIPALHRLIDTGIVRVLDIAFVHKDANGKLTTVELDDLPPDEYAEFDPLVGVITGYFSSEDFVEHSRQLENNSSAVFLLFENTWATQFRDAVFDAKGEILLLERIPKAVIDEMIAEQAATTTPQPDTIAQPPM